MITVLTIVSSIITVIGLLWKMCQWFIKLRMEIIEDSKERYELAKYTLDQATNAAKRADIHLFITLRAIEYSKSQIHVTIIAVSSFLCLLFWPF